MASELLAGIAQRRELIQQVHLEELSKRLLKFRHAELTQRQSIAFENKRRKLAIKTLQREFDKLLAGADSRYVGFFRELPYGKSTESLEASMLKSGDKLNYDRAIILDYLAKGTFQERTKDIDYDVLAKEKREIGYINIKTDHLWRWPESLIYYVEHYSIFLRSDFVRYIEIKTLIKNLSRAHGS